MTNLTRCLGAVIASGAMLLSINAHAGDTATEHPSLLQTTVLTGKKFTTETWGLHDLTNITELVGPQSGCDLHRGVIKVDGLQFSKSGATLESFRFIDSTGTQWSIPTNIENFSNAEKRVANSFIRVGHAYFVIFAVCGSGGFPSLVEMVDVTAIKPL